jgi:hypothetical protein
MANTNMNNYFDEPQRKYEEAIRSAIGAGRTRDECCEETQEREIHIRMNSLDQRLVGLANVTAGLGKRLCPVVSPAINGRSGLKGDTKAIPRSPLAERLAGMGDRLQAAIDDLVAIAQGLEL